MFYIVHYAIGWIEYGHIVGFQIAWGLKRLIRIPLESVKKILKLIKSRPIHYSAHKFWLFCMEMVRVLKKNILKIKFDLNLKRFLT
jgi:hypothetical protein